MMKSIITSTGFGLLGGLLGIAIWSLFCSSVCMDSKDQSAESSSIGNNHLREPAFGESLLLAVRDNQQGVKNLSYRIAFIEKKLHELAASMNADQTWYADPETTPVTGEASEHPEEPPRKELVAGETPVSTAPPIRGIAAEAA